MIGLLMKRLSLSLLMSICFAATPIALASEPQALINQTSPVSVPTPPALAADVQSVDGIIAALYEVISGGVGQARI